MTIDDFLAAAIGRFRAADVWDQDPSLGILIRDAEGDLFAMEWVPDGIWADCGHPLRALQQLTLIVTMAGPPPLVGIELVGLVMVSEGYGIEGDPRPADWWRTHSIADDPAGYELVSAIAVDVDGIAYGREYRRGAAEGHAFNVHSGALVDELRRLVDALHPAEVAS